MALKAGQIFAGYEILCELGRGGMGAVYQARQLSLQRTVALKILPPHLAGQEGFLARFQSEAIAAANVSHPNIVQVFTSGESDGIEYIAMEFVEGETIQQRVKRCGRLPLTEALDVAYHIAEALNHAWQTTHLIHRDVKPDNIFLATNGVVKLGDFGLAKMLRDGITSATVTGWVLGSAHFMSPEQARGDRGLDCRSDIYSLGCTLHYLMTGRTVFEGPDFMSVMYKQVNETPAPLHTLFPNCPAAVNRLLSRMLAKSREERHQTYEELIEDILHARHEAEAWEKGDERQRRRLAQLETTPSRSRWFFAVVLSALLIVAAGYVQAKRAERKRAVNTSITLVDPSDRRDFVRNLADLSPQDRIARVMSKMRELNPDFTGKERYAVEDDAVTELSFSSIGVQNLWPLCALQNLRVLKIAGDSTNRRRSELTDIEALAELPLEEVDISWTNVEDLQPLANLPLRVLRAANTRVKSLAPLQELALDELDVAFTEVADLAPLRGMTLTVLRCNDTEVRDLSPLREMPLRTVSFDARLVPRSSDVIRSWWLLESLNGAPPRGLAERLLPRKSN